MEDFVFAVAIVFGTVGFGVVIVDSIFRLVEAKSDRYRYRAEAKATNATIVFTVVAVLVLLAVGATTK